MKQLKVIIAGGGTGGHIFPAVSIGHALQRLYPGTELLFVGAKGKMEMEKVPLEGFRIVGLDIAGFNRSHLWKNISLPFKLWKSWLQARNVIRQFKPDVIVGVGGYASFPVLNAGQRKNIPTLVQEQNSFAGKSNMILAKRAARVCVAYEGMERFFPKEKIQLTGNPVRKTIATMRGNSGDARVFFGLARDVQTVLVVGGSLGAKSVNESIDAGLEVLMLEKVQLIWQTGKHYYEQAKKRVAGLEGKVKVFEFIREMEQAYMAADLVVSRAGALAIAELCIAARPVIFVPFPFAAEDHQTSNAMALVKQGAAILVKDAEARSVLVQQTVALIHNTEMQRHMEEELRKLAIRDADERIAMEVAGLVDQLNG